MYNSTPSYVGLFGSAGATAVIENVQLASANITGTAATESGTLAGHHCRPKLAAAYGIAVTGTMAITSVLYFIVIRTRRRHRNAPFVHLAISPATSDFKPEVNISSRRMPTSG